MMDEEALANRVLGISTILIQVDYPEESKLVRQLWADRQYLLVRCKIIAAGLADEPPQGNTRDEVAEWAREAYETVQTSI